MSHFLSFSEQVQSLSEQATERAKRHFDEIERITEYNQQKVLSAFIENRVSEACFGASTGYGYGDRGRETLDRVVADAFGAEDALIRHSFSCGTHTLGTALFGVLRPGDTMLSVTGRPYDTICPVIGIAGEQGQGSLADFGISYRQIDLTADGKIDIPAVKDALRADSSIKMVYIQRSRGYELRDALSCEQIGKLCSFVRECGFDGCIFTDNCYGEFVEDVEPTDCGADVIAGSLIKNAGGGIAPTGGYICGGQKYIDMIGRRLTAPSIGLEVGSFEAGYRYFYQGLFMAPHTVAQALKCSLLIGVAMTDLGYKNYPSTDMIPHDITRCIQFDDADAMVNFIREVQYASPVDSYVTCEPWDMPGYDDDIIMAAGTFVSGASIELSADGPVKPPYIAYFQGGLTYEHGKYALMRILSKLKK